MLANWIRWLPLAVVVWIAKRKCQRVGKYSGLWWHTAFRDVLIKADD